MVNTPYVEWTLDFNAQEIVEANQPGEFVGRYLDFGFGYALYVTAVEGPRFFDDLGLDEPFVLNHLYASGTRTDPVCRFNP